MKNKFLEKYPQLRDPKIGDVVKVIKSSNIGWYRNNDIGKIIRISQYPEYGFNLYYVDIIKCANKNIIGPYQRPMFLDEFEPMFLDEFEIVNI